ncbi:Putative ribonuclease H protein At1g65750 [Linum perenne]
MQTSLIPVATCIEIDKRVRNFIWGSSSEERKVHLISWDRICLPKNQGGLGIRSARTLNRAYMVKLAFRFFKEHEPLWVQVLQSKYFRTTTEGFRPRHTSSISPVWKGITTEWQTMLRGSRAAVRDGLNTKFWSSIWVDGGLCLLDFASQDQLNLNLGEPVAAYVGMSPPNPNRGEDEWSWGAEPDGRFSIQSAYALAANEDSNAAFNQDIWKNTWQWKGPNRVRHFLWLAAHDRLLTNDQRTRRTFTTDPHCPLCPGQIENTLHILRDCPFASSVWTELGIYDQTEALWSDNLNSWLAKLLNSEKNLCFGNVCWILWKERNARAFSGSTASAKSVAVRASTWTGVVAAAQQRDDRTIGTRQSRQSVDIGWDPGPAGWFTINTDGAVEQRSGRAAAGGLIRNEQGHCIAAFSMNIGKCSITRAELRGAISGLKCAWDIGLRKVELQVDSSVVTKLFQEEGIPTHQHSMEVMDFQDLMRREWDIKVRHVYREGNRAADFLASLGFNITLGYHSIVPSDPRLGLHLRYDCIGITEPRSILLND